jgi:hypothetical protein
MTVALLDAGTPMIGCLVGVTLGWRHSKQTQLNTPSWQVVIEPTLQETQRCDILCHYIIDQNQNVVSEWDYINSECKTQSESSHSIHSIPENVYWESRAVALRSAQNLHSFIRVTTQKLITYQQQITS